MTREKRVNGKFNCFSSIIWYNNKWEKYGNSFYLIKGKRIGKINFRKNQIFGGHCHLNLLKLRKFKRKYLKLQFINRFNCDTLSKYDSS